MEREILTEMRRRLVRVFMDMVVLAELMKRNLMSGYDVITLIHKKFHILLSSGTVYSVLYSMERDGLIKGMWNERKRVYKLTDKGEKTIKTVLKENEEIHNFMRTLIGRSLARKAVAPPIKMRACAQRKAEAPLPSLTIGTPHQGCPRGTSARQRQQNRYQLKASA